MIYMEKLAFQIPQYFLLPYISNYTLGNEPLKLVLKLNFMRTPLFSLFNMNKSFVKKKMHKLAQG